MFSLIGGKYFKFLFNFSAELNYQFQDCMPQFRQILKHLRPRVNKNSLTSLFINSVVLVENRRLKERHDNIDSTFDNDVVPVPNILVVKQLFVPLIVLVQERPSDFRQLCSLTTCQKKTL